MIDIGNRIAALRERQALTQEELSYRLDISRAALSHYEKNRREPNYRVLVSIASFFKVSTDYLLGQASSVEAEPVCSGIRRGFPKSIKLDDPGTWPDLSMTVDGKPVTADELHLLVAYIRQERRQADHRVKPSGIIQG